MVVRMKLIINEKKCNSCGLCLKKCPIGGVIQYKKCLIGGVIQYDDRDVVIVAKPDICTRCGQCIDVCPNEAIRLE